MFAEAHRTLLMRADIARARLARAMADGGLVHESRRAVDKGFTFLMRVGPGAARVASRQVTVRLLPPRQVGDTTVVPLRWEATGATGGMFPVLDANLGLSPAGPGRSLLSIIGSYRPPLGRLGEVVDRAVMSKVANATLDAFLTEIAAHLATLTSPGGN